MSNDLEGERLKREYERASRKLPNGAQNIPAPKPEFIPGMSFVVAGVKFTILSVQGSLIHLRETEFLSQADELQIIKRRKKLGLDK